MEIFSGNFQDPRALLPSPYFCSSLWFLCNFQQRGSWFSSASDTTHIQVRASQVALMVKNSPANARDTRDMGLIPGSGVCPGGGNGNPLQYSCLENHMDRGAWQAMVHSVTQIWTQLKQLSTHTRLYVRQSSVFCFRLFQLSSSGRCPCSKSSS